jgi:hypothetical protein
MDEIVGRQWARDLKILGDQLSSGIFPRVSIGGVVLSGNSADIQSIQGKGNENVYREKRTRAKRRAEQTAPWSPRKPRAPSEASSFKCANILSYYENSNLREVMRAYPQTIVQYVTNGMWLRIESQLLRNFQERVTFLVLIANCGGPIIRSWAFWTTAQSVQWIGPRHTNYPDGSICAFLPQDNSWCLGESLVALLDIYHVWALRQLHLRVHGTWPGPQHSSHLFERLSEFQDAELCGCDEPNGTYNECCKNADFSLKKVATLTDISFMLNSAFREPPNEIVRFAKSPSAAPGISFLKKFVVFRSD